MKDGDSRPWRWITLQIVLSIHDRQIAEHGGADGIRDLGAIDSALARPINLAAYGDPDAASLAAAYALGLAQNHGFADGNKRTAWVAARLFLADNDFRFECPPRDAIQIMLKTAGGAISESQLADWFRQRLAN